LPPLPLERRPGTLLVLALWFGLFSGLLGVLYRVAIKALGMSWYLRVSPDFVWMTPLVEVLVFLVPGLVFFGLARARPVLPWLRVAVFTYATLLFVKVLLLYGKLHEGTMLILAVGLAIQAARLLVPRLARLRPWIHRSFGWMLALAVGLAVTRAGVVWSAHRNAAAARAVPPADAPNVLLISLDTVRARSLSLYGYHRRTSPNLERWAKKGVTFDRAMATSPWTLPTHASLFTGRYPDDLSTSWHTPLDNRYPTLAEILHARGYATAGFVANRYYAGIDSGLGRGFALYEDYTTSPGEFINCSTLTKWLFGRKWVRGLLGQHDLLGRKDGGEVNRSFLDWHARHTDRPFFAFLNYFDAHDPYLPAAPFDSRFGPPLTAEQKALMTDWWPCYKLKLTREQIELAERAYDSCLAELDEHLGRLLGELERRGVMQNTLLIITSDHGEHFGEHNLMLHGNSLYRDLVHVPLVVVFPGRVPADQRTQAFASLRDVPATVLDLLRQGGRSPFPGRSLARYWDGRGGPETPVFCAVQPGDWPAPNEHRCSPVARGSMVSVFLEGKHYIRNLGDGVEELYDFAGDPREQDNLARSAAGAALLERYRAAVRKAIEED
jgi:arylsulfatase A-like enzyme